jgi:aryl-alcohol dehydrogenase-like predicted oxidoreductase
MHVLLGFGTAPVLGKHGRRVSREAILCALDAGIRHFDTARSYGWGEAEGLLGETMAGIPRGQLIIVSKCGYMPVPRTRLLGLAKAVARTLVRRVPMLGGVARKAAGSAALRPVGTYDLPMLEASLKTSLAELRTDYLDVLILHNFNMQTEGVEPVVAWMRGLKSAGTIRDYGFSVGESFLESLDWLEAKGFLRDAVVQAPLSAGMLAVPERYRDVDVIVHSPFTCRDPGLSQLSADLPALARALAAGFRCRAIVCSMFSPEHIKANAASMARAVA